MSVKIYPIIIIGYYTVLFTIWKDILHNSISLGTCSVLYRSRNL